MPLHRFFAFAAASFAASLVVAASSKAGESELNFWPVRVSQIDDAGQWVSWQAAGPLIFKKPAADGGTAEGFRPLFAKWRTASHATREINVLYPLFTYRTDGETYRWSVFQLVNRSGDRAERVRSRPPSLTYETFDVWPFWFSRDTGSPDSSYRGLFPIVGTIKSRFGYDELRWTLFPFYGRAEKRGAITYATPWPFIRTTRGAEHGFAFWPLFGWGHKPGSFDRHFYLWPLGWNNTIQPGPDAPAGTLPRREVGFLPFYSRETATGFVNESLLWPFFGYTDRTQPTLYHETRYFWPLLVRGRGDNRHVDRFGPFFTHSIKKGTDKTWVMWPVYREKRWQDSGIAQTQRQVLYFLYWSLEQKSLTNPAAAPAEKSHLWPLYSHWDNGAGREQFQFPSPLEVFFPDNERVRQSWSPLFSLYRHDQRAPDFVRDEALWGLLSWTRRPDRKEFHFGPLISLSRTPEQKRFALGNGLFGLRRTAGSGWRFFWFDFPPKANNVRAASR